MATYITPTVIAKQALANLYNSTILLPLIYRDYEGDFNGKQGDTITVRIPATFTAAEFVRATGIVLQDPTEGSFNFTLNKFPDVSFPVTSEDLTLRLDRFDERLLQPAAEAHAQYADGLIAEQLVDAAETVGGGGTVNGTGTSLGERHAAFRAARRVLSRNKLPFAQRYGVLSPEAVEVVTSDQLILQANTSASTEALREGSVGRLSGFDNYETQQFGYGPNDKGQADGVAFHRSAVAAALRTPEAPMGLPSTQTAVENYKGLGLRVTKAYDINKKQDVVSLDVLMGVATIRKEAAVQLNFGQGS